MGLFDTFFSSVTGGSREPQKPSNVELELRRRLTVLASDEATQDTPQRYFLRWEGQVQGVGFRYRSFYIAQSLGLTGWVENLWDGRVEMEVQGSEASIREMLARIQQQRWINVTDMEITEIPCEEERGFKIR